MKLYAIIGGLVVLLGAFAGTWYLGNSAGKDAERARTAAQIEEYRDNQRLLVNKLEEANAKERIVYKTKIKTIRQVVDECANVEIHKDILTQLR